MIRPSQSEIILNNGNQFNLVERYEGLVTIYLFNSQAVLRARVQKVAEDIWIERYPSMLGNETAEALARLG